MKQTEILDSDLLYIVFVSLLSVNKSFETPKLMPALCDTWTSTVEKHRVCQSS